MKKNLPVTAVLSDRAANRDLLDFKPYTDTLLDIICDENTMGPLGSSPVESRVQPPDVPGA